MTDPTPAAEPAKGRADARRNRDKVLAAARASLAGGDESLAMVSVARDAGVGVGTLYRHFPTREALVEAVYAAELDDVTTSATTLLEQLPPEAALRAWLERYAAFLATKRSMMDALRSSFAAGRMGPHTREQVTGAFRALLDSGARAGTLRDDVDPDDAAGMLHGIFLTAGHDPQRTSRMLGLLADALRAR
ncbi:TetR/AcrR family transcriptional regulator [Actinoplanes sp. L3-i22]|uniref:TetR/AcrR family transcriptional regulator n=1 Tax=Actinoplanes sp. L3-i22 TaxID=2836373 RepID=UPI001C75AD12|nr:TetR/AcrR family transcriptional regulator [Actinoplanes sp. L3-i22]BCY09137.1 TetR family transcriptional regulator [Actinoplanes sp. L3-i22]